MSAAKSRATFDLISQAIGAEEPKAVERLGPVIESVLDVARAQAAAAGLDAQAVMSSVNVTHKARDESFAAASARAQSRSRAWPFPFSGKICIWYCPEGGPYDEETCYLICIEWWFPVLAA